MCENYKQSDSTTDAECPSTFNTKGFLAEDDQGFLATLKTEHGKYIQLCEELNEFAQKLQFALPVHGQNVTEISSALLFSRVLSNFQATLIVSFKGMRYQVDILTRCILEPLFPLVAISKDRSHSDDFVNTDACSRLRLIKNIIRYRERNGSDTTDLDRLKELKDSTEETINENGAKVIDKRMWSQKAGLEDWYDTVYSMASDTLHSSAMSLERALCLDPSKEGEIHAIDIGPEFETFDACYAVIANCLIHALKAVGRIFPRVVNKKELDDFESRLEKLNRAEN